MYIGERRFFHAEKSKLRPKAENELLFRRKFGYHQNLARANKAYYKANSGFIKRAFFSGFFNNKFICKSQNPTEQFALPIIRQLVS